MDNLSSSRHASNTSKTVFAIRGLGVPLPAEASSLLPETSGGSSFSSLFSFSSFTEGSVVLTETQSVEKATFSWLEEANGVGETARRKLVEDERRKGRPRHGSG